MTTYATYQDVDTFARSNGHSSWIKIKKADKLLICNWASDDIEVAHKISRPSPRLPYKLGDITLNDICIQQALYIGRNFEQRKTQEKVNSSTGRDYKVGSFSFNRNDNTQWSSMGWQMLQNWIKDLGVGTTKEFDRG